MQSIFHYFINNTWIFESLMDDKVMSLMSPEELNEFRFDMRTINWKKAIGGYCHGIRRFYFKEDCLTFEHGYEQIFAQNQINWFHDIKVSRRITASLVERDNRDYFTSVLSQQKFQQYLQKRIKNLPKDSGIDGRNKVKQEIKQTMTSSLSFNMEAAKRQLEEMHA